jgi:cytoskeletal protein CcmA (bactofilin family)
MFFSKFAKNKSTTFKALPEKFDTLIGKNTAIHGRLVLLDSIRIDGKVVGNIESSKDESITVVIGASGEVQGDIVAHRVVVAGKVSGHIHAHERVELHADCLVQGDIKYGSIAIEHGSKVLGLLLQVGATAAPNMSDADAQSAIRKAQAVTGSGN